MERLAVDQPVRIKADLEVGKAYKGLRFVTGMEQYRGKRTKVVYVYEDNYDLEIDKGQHGWTDRMLEKTVDVILHRT